MFYLVYFCSCDLLSELRVLGPFSSDDVEYHLDYIRHEFLDEAADYNPYFDYRFVSPSRVINFISAYDDFLLSGQQISSLSQFF